MPVYESICRKCGKVHDYYQTVDNRHDTPECCGEKTDKAILTPSMGIVDIPAYVSPVSGRWVNSRKQRKEDLAEANCRPWEGLEQEKKEAARRQEYLEQAQDKKLEQTIEQTIKDLPEQKKAVLGLT